MIGEPVNDGGCLSKVTDSAIEATERDDIRRLASRFGSSREVAAWIRSLPQRDDDGNLADGPRVTCDVSQRLRIPADDPNCVERSALYVAAAELVDSRPVRQLATIETPLGRHTFPVEDDVPVRLDPRVPRNALEAGLFRLQDADVHEASVADALGWIGRIAREPAGRYAGGERRVRNARLAMSELLDGQPLRRNAVDDLGFALVVAEQAARMFGVRGVEMVKVGAAALRYALRNGGASRHRNFSISIPGIRIAPQLGSLVRLARVGGRIGERVGAAALRTALGHIGVGPGVIREVEKELNRERMTLGAVAKPPMPGSLAALTAHALA